MKSALDQLIQKQDKTLKKINNQIETPTESEDDEISFTNKSKTKKSKNSYSSNKKSSESKKSQAQLEFEMRQKEHQKNRERFSSSEHFQGPEMTSATATLNSNKDCYICTDSFPNNELKRHTVCKNVFCVPCFNRGIEYYSKQESSALDSRESNKSE